MIDNSIVDNHFIANCDRRLSRAARSYVTRKTYLVLSHHFYSANDPSNNSISSSNMESTCNAKTLLSSPAMQMEFYKKALDALMTQPTKCVLNMNPSRDVFWNVDHRSMYQKLSYSKVKRRHVYTCPMCRKQFITLFYLDLHIRNHHDINDLMQNIAKNTNFICPARDICSILGTTTCHLEALKNEPYYARGDLIDFSNKDSVLHMDGNANSKHDMSLAKATKRSYQRQIMDMPCNEQELAQSRMQCLQAMEDCFGGENGHSKDSNGSSSLLSDMQKILCEVKSCQDHLGDIVGDYRNVYDESSLHLLKHGWEYHMSHVYIHDMRVGFSFVFLVMLLGFYVAIINGCFFCTNGGFDRWFIKKRRRTFDHNRQIAKKLD